MGRCLKKSVKFSGVIERFVRCLDFWWVETRWRRFTFSFKCVGLFCRKFTRELRRPISVALLFSYARQIPQYNARAKAGYEWGRVEGMDWHLSGRTLGLVEKLRSICAELENAHED